MNGFHEWEDDEKYTHLKKDTNKVIWFTWLLGGLFIVVGILVFVYFIKKIML